MSGSGSDRIQVDPGALETLAMRIGNVRSQLQSAQQGADIGEPELGSALVYDALQKFNADWSDRRGQLINLLEHSETLLHNAADEFRQADAQLASAFGGTTAESGAAH